LEAWQQVQRQGYEARRERRGVAVPRRADAQVAEGEAGTLPLRLGAGVLVRVGGAVGQQASSSARPDGRGARDAGWGAGEWRWRSAAHADLLV